MISHSWSCDSSLRNQKFIMAQWGPTVVFPDIKCLCESTAVDIDKNTQVISEVDLFCCGFECDSISSLNAKATRHRACLKTQTDKTGSTGAGCIQYVLKHSPGFILLENVKSLGAKAPDHLKQILNAADYLLSVFLVSSHKYGSPQHRERWYILGFKCPGGPHDQTGRFDPPSMDGQA